MSAYFLASPRSVPSVVRPTKEPVPKLVLESLDGRRRIPLDDSTGWKALAGATGLDMPPVDVATRRVPGVAGSVLDDVRAEERPLFIPIKVTARDRQNATHRALMDSLRALVDPLLGEFRVIGITATSERELTAVYTDGLQGDYGVDQAGLHWRKFGLRATACQPFAAARTSRTVEFQMAGAGGAFLGVAGGTDAPWPRALSSSAVIGEGMQVQVNSEVEVHPTLELVGPMTSFAGELSPLVTGDDGAVRVLTDQAWSVSVPDGVPAGMALRLVADPRARSIRLGAGDPRTTPGWTGELAAGRVARGSTLRPFYPGLNVLNVSAPGGTTATRVRLSWRELHRSLW
ncbi:hypothetical protein [Blastococcus xanthinilyticus]|uniref:Tail protein n=1 Tax=Blastococcus xanthinilyticus TaxID=1564164 RepID=A0A5S5CLL1_9ACTN|nr:hypothetical protein [Blastococcus xanthinilyticus]TYP82077.1 hypothetical protein BD833_12061 [Blastococcus xanthinilyticus]